MSAPLLCVQTIRAGYDRLEILQGVSLEVADGGFAGIIGPNGAGKSTLLKAIFGYLTPFSGQILMNDKSIVGLRPDQLIGEGIAYVAQSRMLFQTMTVRENLLLGAYTQRRTKAKLEALESALVLFPQFRDRLSQLAGTLSGGQQKSLAIARAMTLQPKLLLLDEPSAALDPQSVESVFEKLTDINRSGVALLIVEQNVEVLLDYARHIFVLDVGRNAFDGSGETLRKMDKIRRLYLGIQPGDTDD